MDKSKIEIENNDQTVRTTLAGMATKEHDKIQSRISRRMVEVEFGPLPSGYVPKNPFASQAQAGYLHAQPEKLGAAKLTEFDRASKGLKLPKRVKK